jgi:excisionase family DNA binding protein
MIIRGLDGCVVLSPAACQAFAPLVHQAMTNLVRRDGVRFPSELWAELDAMEAAARAFRQCRTTTTTPEVVPTTGETLPAGRISTMELTVAEVAAREGTSRQAVTARIRRRTLPARRDEGGHWKIRQENLATERKLYR